MKPADFTNELSVEQIRNRMIRNAARVWGVELEEIESTFDPIVTMLIESCAYELNKINRVMTESRTRILNRLAQTLSPEAITGPMPAHTVLQARSIEIETVLKSDAQFNTIIRQHSADVDKKEVSKDIYFSPLKSIKLFDTQVRYAVHGSRIYEYKSGIGKQLIAEEPQANLNPHTLWIGLEINSKIQSLHDFVFFIDWKNDPDEQKYLKVLPLTKWSVGPYKLDAVQGIRQEIENENEDFPIDNEYDVTSTLQKTVEAYYNDSFYTLKSGDSSRIRVQDFLLNYPSEAGGVFSEKALSSMERKVLWVKLQFNTALPPQAIQDVIISVNSFPAINRRFCKLTYQLKSSLNIIPLKAAGLFHDVIQVASSEGYVYRSNPLGSGFSNNDGYYTLRSGGLERFDDRHAAELLNNVLDLLRDESAAFSSMGNEFINVQINQINNALAIIENRLDLKASKDSPTHFLLVKPNKKNETVFVKFWTTEGVNAHAVKPGTKLTIQSNADVRSDSVYSLINTGGGKQPLTDSEKVLAFKKTLLTQNRLFTEHDIQVFCTQYLGNLASRVTVSKAWDVPSDRNSGIIRILEVTLYPASREGFVHSEWRSMAHALQTRIRLYSSSLIPIRVVVNTASLTEKTVI